MTVQGKIYKGADKVVVILDSKGEILTGETLTISVLKPGSTTPIIKNATVFETTKAKYTSGTDEFDVAGVYKFQLIITSANGSWRGETVERMVFDHFN